MQLNQSQQYCFCWFFFLQFEGSSLFSLSLSILLITQLCHLFQTLWNSSKSASGYLKSKFLGDMAVMEEFPDATIIRPSEMIGTQDWFTWYEKFVRISKYKLKPVQFKLYVLYSNHDILKGFEDRLVPSQFQTVNILVLEAFVCF